MYRGIFYLDVNMDLGLNVQKTMYMYACACTCVHMHMQPCVVRVASRVVLRACACMAYLASK